MLEIAFRRVTPTFLCEDEVEEIATLRSADTDIQCLAGYIRDQDIEIERSHQRNADQAAHLDGLSSEVADHRASLQRMAPRLAAADAFIPAYKTTQAAQYKSNDYYAAASALEAAEVAYDALAGTGEGAS